MGSGGACRARLGGGSPCHLVTPLVQEEVRRRLWAPPGQGPGRCLESATGGCSLAPPLVQEEVRRRLLAPPDQGLGRCLLKNTWPSPLNFSANSFGRREVSSTYVSSPSSHLYSSISWVCFFSVHGPRVARKIRSRNTNLCLTSSRLPFHTEY